MKLRTILRINPGVWIVPILVILAVLATTATGIPVQMPEPYLLALTAAGGTSVFVVAPVCAACAAWEGGRLRRAEWWTLPHTRSLPMIALASVTPIIIVGLVAITAAIAVNFWQAGIVAIPDARIALKSVVLVAAHALLGFAIGTRVRPVIAVPSVLLVDYGWMVLPVALEPVWLRHLNGTWSSCCMLSTDLAPQAFAGAVIVAFGLTATAVLLLRPSLRRAQLPVTIMPMVLVLGVGALLVRGLDWAPVVARDPSLLVCSSGQPQVCVWPEHRVRLEEVAALASDAATRWREVGIAVPDTFSEASSGSLLEHRFGFSLESRQPDIISSLAYSMLPPFPECAVNGEYLGGEALEYVYAWYADVAGLSRAGFENRFGPEVLSTIEVVRALPVEQQRAWLDRNLAAIRVCDVEPYLEAGR